MKTTYGATPRIATAMLALASLFTCLIQRVPALPPPRAKSLASRAGAPKSVPTDDAANKMRVQEAYGKLPMSFEPNRGQTDRKVKYLSRGSGYTLFLTQTEATLALYKNESEADSISPSHHSRLSSVVRMRLKGANPRPKIEGLESLQGKSNYLIGNDRARWHTDIPTFAQVKYTGVYPGIDVVYYGQQRQLEYDFRLAAGADASKIRIAFAGAENLSLDTEGNLVLKTSGGEIIQHAPVIYQENESGRQSIAGRYVLKGAHEIGFEVSAYDRSKPLVIDPQLVYATFYGGSSTDLGNGIDVDNNGNAYITGQTNSVDLLLANAFQGSLGSFGPDDAFVVKLNATGTSIIYATYLGGDTTDEANAIAVTSDGRACIAGGVDTANSVGNGNFPVTLNAFQNNVLGSPDAFLTVLTAAGNDLFYSTRFGGRCTVACIDGNKFKDEAFGIALDSSNRVYITGSTNADNFPTKNAFQNSRGSSNDTPDAFIAKFDPSQSNNSSLLFSSYLGGSGTEIGRAVAVGPSGNAYMVGETGSFNFPTKASAGQTPFQTSQGGVSDAFIAQVSSTGTLVYSTFFGGNGAESARAVAVDSAQRVYVTGFTESSAATFPLVHAFDSTTAGRDAFVAKMNAGGTALFYSSFLGGVNPDEGRGIAIDSAGNAYVTGRTSSSTDFPTVNGLPQNINSGSSFITKIEPSDATGTTTPKILYSDIFGGSGTEGNAVALDTKGNVYITGRGGSNLQTTPGAFQAFNRGNNDAFVVKIGSTFPDTIGVFRPSTGQFLLRNSNTTGNPDLTLTFGQAGDKPVVGDWNGDGITDIGVFRNGSFFLATVQTTLGHACLTCPFTFQTTLTQLPQFSFGTSGGRPVAGDWNGDGIDTIGVFSNGTFQLRNSNTTGSADLSFGFGTAGDLPVAGDWNGDGIDTIGVASSIVFALRNSNSGGPADIAFSFGDPADLAFIGDWDGNGIDTVGLLRNGTVFLRNSNTTGIGDVTFGFGQTGDIPVAGDWNGRPDPFTPPNGGINDPNTGSSSPGQLQAFTTTCSDPDGWHDLSTIDFKIAKSDGNGNGVPMALWVQFNENTGLVRFYDPDTQTWQEGEPGTNVVLSSRFAELHLGDTVVVGSGPTGPSVQIMWSVLFKDAAIMNNYKQYLKITDDAGLTTGFDKVGSWSVNR